MTDNQKPRGSVNNEIGQLIASIIKGGIGGVVFGMVAGVLLSPILLIILRGSEFVIEFPKWFSILCGTVGAILPVIIFFQKPSTIEPAKRNAEEVNKKKSTIKVDYNGVTRYTPSHPMTRVQLPQIPCDEVELRRNQSRPRTHTVTSPRPPSPF